MGKFIADLMFKLFTGMAKHPSFWFAVLFTCAGAAGMTFIFWLIGVVRRHYKLVFACGSVVSAVVLLWMVFG